MSAIASSPGVQSQVTRVGDDEDLYSVGSYLAGMVDVVVAEGFKESSAPKVLVYKDGEGAPEVENVIATVGNGASPDSTPPGYSRDDLVTLADRVEAEVLSAPADKPTARLVVDGRETTLSGYPTRAIAGILEGFVGSLKGAPESPSKIEISVELLRE